MYITYVRFWEIERITHLHPPSSQILSYSGDPEIGPLMGLTESGPILESVRFVKPTNYAWRDTSQSVYRYALLLCIKCI